MTLPPKATDKYHYYLDGYRYGQNYLLAEFFLNQFHS